MVALSDPADKRANMILSRGGIYKLLYNVNPLTDLEYGKLRGFTGTFDELSIGVKAPPIPSIRLERDLLCLRRHSTVQYIKGRCNAMQTDGSLMESNAAL